MCLFDFSPRSPAPPQRCLVFAIVVGILRFCRRGGGGGGGSGGGGRSSFSGIGGRFGGGGALAEEAVECAPVDGGRCGVGRVETGEGAVRDEELTEVAGEFKEGLNQSEG
ncbi:hypothetical protein CHLRE_03g143707v5 [Chlamydomonas reinhardtii]|uniref:Uncharacterized protein n=1 Tax=Chlamydomonas reinhardtii TaxID=3055 RepID=A0A2K3DV35_CHLRE|nr:uncharacterized protein CHLRE_03g143707v5 [Chlamydomonas reinhardtii]PNW84372.1 hypothetical protein CHLRE_03g143707v5 [Chlamydomonas reinhardtii]